MRSGSAEPSGAFGQRDAVFRLLDGIRLFLEGGHGSGFSGGNGGLGVGQRGGHGLGQRRDHAFLFAHRRVGLAFLAAVAATAATAIAAGAGVIASGLGCLLGAVVGQRGLVAIGAGFVTALALATFRPFGAFRTLGALAFGTAVAAHVLAAAFGAFSAVAARFIAAVAVAVRAMAFAAAVLAVVAALAAAGGAALGGVFLGSGAAAGLALSPLPVSQPTRRLNRPPRPPEAAGAGAAAAGAGAGGHGRGLRGRDALDQRFRAALDLVLARLPGGIRGRSLDQPRSWSSLPSRRGSS